MAEGTNARTEFLAKVLDKTEQQLRAHWTRMIFTGKAKPPRNAQTAEEVLRYVSDTPGAIGYVESEKLPSTVKVVFRIN